MPKQCQRRILPIYALIAFVLVSGIRATAEEKRMPPLTDKTLVAWVSLDTLTQQGGAALTLIDAPEHFDAIVFGERAVGKWMAGSDFFKRTPADQSAWPVEHASATAIVQIAAAYRGNVVTLYRDGVEYARYVVESPQSFGDDAKVLLGLRYVGSMGEIGFLAGTMEDARVYDTALDTEAIRALKPGIVSVPTPRAWWNFQNGTADDVMGAFPVAELVGGARVENGRLVLDGKTGYLVCSRPVEPVKPGDQNIFYKARLPQTGNMWDTWLFHRDGTYHLYYLANAHGQWDNISIATSPDGVSWTELGPILTKGPGVTWMGTGSTWQSPNFDKDGKFFMNFSEWKGPRQTIFFAQSTDLVHWQRLGQEYEFVQDERWYEPNGRWDCIWTLPRPGGGLYGYWTATPKKNTGGRFGFGESDDGVTWHALEPPKVIGVGEGEVGAVERVGDRYCMMFGTGGIMVTLLADSPEGPFRKASKNYSLLSGHTYFSRFFPSPDGLLVNHHSIARNGQVSLAPLKQAAVDDEGTMRLGWWQGNERMKHEAIQVNMPSADAAAKDGMVMLDPVLPAEKGVILEGRMALPSGKSRRGLYIECTDGNGIAVLLNAGGAASLGPMKADGSGFKAEKKVDREMQFGTSTRFRLLLKNSLLEFYLEDILVECFSLPSDATGRVRLVTGNAPDAFAGLAAWR
jgi:hypothetical protein